MVRINTLTANYKNVNRLYPNGKITGIKQICFNRLGWQDATYINTLYNSLSLNVEHLKEHANAVQLEVINQYGIKCYPDYKLTEL